MKINILILNILIITLSINVFSQNNSVTITSNKVKYERKGEEIPDHKKTFEVNYPNISGIFNPKVKENLENTIDYWKNFEMTLEENLGEYNWLSSMDYVVNYNKNSILDIQLIMEGSGAYPSVTSKSLVINLKTGRKIQITDVFTNIGQLLVKIDKAQKTEITKAKADEKKEGESIDELLGSNNSINKLEEFSVSDKGITFLYDYQFPHVALALQPEGRYFYTFQQLKPLIKRDGLLGQFVR